MTPVPQTVCKGGNREGHGVLQQLMKQEQCILSKANMGTADAVPAGKWSEDGTELDGERDKCYKYERVDYFFAHLFDYFRTTFKLNAQLVSINKHFSFQSIISV